MSITRTVPHDDAIMHLNAAVDNNTPEDPSGGVPDFYFLNLEDDDEANSNEGNPYANI